MSRKYIKPNEVIQMRGNMFKKKQIDNKQKCYCCKTPIEKASLDEYVGIVVLKEKGSRVVCNNCIKYLEEKGVENLEYKISEQKQRTESLRKEYKEIYTALDEYWEQDIKNKTDKELQTEVDKGRMRLKRKKEKERLIEGVDTSKWCPLEGYLKTQYNVIEDKRYLKHEIQIEEYFNSIYRECFECGQGYYEDEVELIVHIGGRFYKVTLYAELGSSKQNYGDRLYWVESLLRLEYKEIEKPERKEEFQAIIVSEKDIDQVIRILNQEGVEYKLKHKECK